MAPGPSTSTSRGGGEDEGAELEIEMASSSRRQSGSSEHSISPPDPVMISTGSRHSRAPTRGSGTGGAAPTCEGIRDPFCLELAQIEQLFNTSFTKPTLLNHSSQEQAMEALQHLTFYEQLDCFQHMRLFLCSAFYPLCTDVPQVLPCREFCIDARDNCAPTFKKFEIDWPDELSCGIFPPTHEVVCIWDKNTTYIEPTVTYDNDTLDECAGILVPFNEEHTYFPGVSYGGIGNCTEPCVGVYFSEGQLMFARVWVGVWSFLCLLLSLSAFVIWVVQYRSFRRPEKTLYYFTFCYIPLSLSFAISSIAGRESQICYDGFTNQFNMSSLHPSPAWSSSGSPLCLGLFLPAYFGLVCSWICWVTTACDWVICIATRLPISLKMRLTLHALNFFFAAAFMLSFMYVGLAIGDTTLGGCWVKVDHQVPYLIAPLMALIVVGAGALLCGQYCMLKLHRSGKMGRRFALKETSLFVMHSIGLFCLLNFINMTILLATFLYQYCYTLWWEESYVKCFNSIGERSATFDCTRPNFAFLMTRVVAMFLPGVVLPIWLMVLRSSHPYTSGWGSSNSSHEQSRTSCCACSLKRKQVALPSLRKSLIGKAGTGVTSDGTSFSKTVTTATSSPSAHSFHHHLETSV